MAGNPKWRNGLARCIPLIYAAGYSCSQYFSDRGVKSLSVYCEEIDYGFGQQICFDLSLSFDVDVRFWLSDAIHKNAPNFPSQNLTASPNFSPVFIDRLTKNDNVLILCSERTNDALAKVHSKTKHTYHIADIWTDMWWRAMMARRFQEIRDLFPFLPIVIFLEPAYPKNKEAYSDIEKYMCENQPGHYARSMLPLLKQAIAGGGGGGIPKSYEAFNYSVEELVEMLDTTRSFLDGRALKLKDYHGNQVNISDGHRIVPNQTENYTRTVYVFGGCMTFGAGCPDGGTSSACLQQLFSDNGMNEFKVENYGMFTFGRKKHVFERIKLLPYKPGDILVSSFSNLHSPKGVTYLPEGVFHVDTLRMFERPHDWGENVFFDTSHPNEIGQRAIAAKVFDFLKTQNFFEGFADSHYAVPVLSANILPREELALLDEYLSTITPLRSAIGAVVLNCNPFTLGHRYLVEQSAQKVARLFIFVVEEDKSVFSFADRIELVRQGTADIPNVTVIPSGKFIISSLTFTDYFGKSELQDRTIDPSMDVRLFGQFIAPKMGINIRFAGEEPLDNVTRQYNDAMRRILPQYGVEFEAIPRKESEGEVISASRVRKLLESKDFDAIAKIVPETTLVYLIEKFGDESDITQKPVIWRKKAGAVLSRIFSRRKQSGRPMDRHGA